MDPVRFDHLARLLGRSGTRRAALAALAAATGFATRVRPAAADWCERNGIGMRDCGPGCNDQRTGPCTCYDPATHYCADADNGILCANGESACRNAQGRVIACTGGPFANECCGDGICRGGYNEVCKVPAQSLCCQRGQVLCPAGGGGFVCAWPPSSDPCVRGYSYDDSTCACVCTSGVVCGNRCCADDQVCENNTCVAACAAGRAMGRAAGLCCNPASEQLCNDRCCPKDDRCCFVGPGATACCPRNRECCTGPDSAACCDPAEAFCCRGVCCANHRACADGLCVDECPDGRVKCGSFCCPDAMICVADNRECRGCDRGETACGRACCGKDEVCEDGKCEPRCRKGQTPCGGACCARNEVCKGGECRKKRKK